MGETIVAYAIPINEQTIKGIILSEAGRRYNVAAAMEWFKEYGEGWFLRDEGHALDCQFFVPEIFTTFYKFSGGDEQSLIRLVKRR